MVTADADGVFLRVEHVRKSYGGIVALSDVALQVGRGRVEGLIGPNGAGKSTLVKILAGIVQPDGGRLLIDGTEVDFASQVSMRQRGIYLVPQEATLVRELSVAENICLGAEDRWGPLVNWRGIRTSAAAALDRLRIDLPLHEPVGNLPLSEQRLVMVARALRFDAQLVILDEPTASMGVSDAEMVLQAVEQLRSDGTAVLYISHRLNEVVRICDHVTAIRDGRTVGTASQPNVSIDQLVEFVTGGRPHESSLGAPPADGPVLLTCKDLVGDEVKGVDLSLRAGIITGLLGRPGSGASETLRILGGVGAMASGSIHVGGRALTARSPAAALKLGVGYLAPDRSIAGIGSLTVLDNVSLASLPMMSKASFATNRRLMQLLRPRVPAELAPRLPNLLSTLSGGNQQKALVARLVVAGVRVLLLDDPTVGVDVRARAELHESIRQLAADGCAVAVLTSEPEELAGLAHEVHVFRGGRIDRSLSGGDVNPAVLLAASSVAVAYSDGASLEP